MWYRLKNKLNWFIRLIQESTITVSLSLLFIFLLIRLVLKILKPGKYGWLLLLVIIVLFLIAVFISAVFSLSLLEKAINFFKETSSNENYWVRIRWLIGALITYLYFIILISFIFSTIFIAVSLFGNNSNHLVDVVNNKTLDSTDNSRILNYNLVTISTLGYGNIIPEGTLYEFLSSLEAIIGSGINAIVIALVIVKCFSPNNSNIESKQKK